MPSILLILLTSYTKKEDRSVSTVSMTLYSLLEVNIKRIRRLMKENGIKSIIQKRFKNYNRSDNSFGTVKNILKGNFNTKKLNEKWVSNITYTSTKR